MTPPESAIRERQLAWAATHCIAVDAAGYTLRPEDNLFAPLSTETRRDFEGGDGAELGLGGKRGKMQALHSSSALAVNVFDYWRVRDAAPLAAALGLAAPIAGLTFERKFGTGLPGNPPNLDVVLWLGGGSIVAIESKFMEPWRVRSERGLKAKYFAGGVDAWARLGLCGCSGLAARLQSGETAFTWLHAEQLLKHVLGLALSGSRWELVYLWYETPGHESGEHAAEAEEFARVARADGIAMRPLTYQKLILRLRESAAEADAAYLDYLDGRYFG